MDYKFLDTIYKTRYRTLSYAKRIRSVSLCFISILILFLYPRLCFANRLLASNVPTKVCKIFLKDLTYYKFILERG